MTDQIRAPWTPEQVAALNRFQAEGGMHPFTCGNDHATGALHLVAHEDGWHCWLPDCEYRQDWAHRFMADPDAWPKPFADLRHAAAAKASDDYEQTTGHVITCTAGFTDICDCPQEPASTPVTAQDAPGGPGQPTGGPETPQTALQRLRRLRGQLAAEHAKAVAADQHPRPDLDHLRVTPHNGIAAGLEIALFFADHHLREAGEEARTTPDNPAASSDAVDNSLREQIAEALLDYLSRTADIRHGSGGSLAFMPEVTDAERLHFADTVLAVITEAAGGGEGA